MKNVSYYQESPNLLYINFITKGRQGTDTFHLSIWGIQAAPLRDLSSPDRAL